MAFRPVCVLVALLILSGCAGDDEAARCSSSADCESGTCIDGACVPGTDGGGGGCGEARDCDDGNPCDGEERCAGGLCLDGSPADNGTACDIDSDPSTHDFCVGGLCAPSRCGDDIVDADAMEECDDGNSTSGDGCDDCRFSCTADAGCGDGEECNGVESCNTTSHACEDGAALMEGADCASGTGACATGICVPRSCTDDIECDDGNPCTGTETCAAMSCAAGTPLDCDDGVACTADTCNPDLTLGCSHRLIDADFDGHSPDTLGVCGDDCDDSDPMVYAGAADACDGVDNDCDGSIDEDDSVVFYADCDGDGFAPAGGTSVTACTMPAVGLTGCPMGGAWTTRAPADLMTTDCNDTNPTVHPAQTMLQTSAITGAPAESDFDYDCDTMEEPGLPTTMGACARIGFGCRIVSSGWIGPVPECGDMGMWLNGCALSGGACLPVSAARIQSCL